MVIGRNGTASTHPHSSEFTDQQRVLKTFPNFGHLHSEVGIWQLLPNSYMYYLHIIILWDACLQATIADGAIIHGVADKCS